MKVIWAIIGILVIIILAVIMLRGGNDKPKTATTSNKKAVVLTDYSRNTSAEVSYIIDGPINAPENHRSVRVTVTPSERRVEVMRGYQGEVVSSKSYSNDADAFAQFLEALSRAGFINERTVKTKPKFEAVCPTGSRYTYQIADNGQDVSKLWSATCNQGTFAGSTALVRQLFQAQIPDYSAVTSAGKASGL